MFVWLAVIIAMAASRLTRWNDPTALWSDAADLAPQKPRAWMNYGQALLADGRVDEAADAYRRAMATSDERPDRRLAHTIGALNLAEMACQRGDVATAAYWRAQVDPSTYAALRARWQVINPAWFPETPCVIAR